MLIKKIVLVMFAAQLIACRSGSTDRAAETIPDTLQTPSTSNNDPYVHFEGIWQGTITPDDTMTSGTAVALVNGWGEFRLLASEAQFVGFPRRTRSVLEGRLTGFRSPGVTWDNGARISQFTISGSIAGDEFIDAVFSGDAGSGSLGLAWVTVTYPTDISDINGTWALLDENQNHVATFNVDVTNEWEARINGAHSNGCIYSGAAESWTSVNSYDIWELSISNCPPIAGIELNGDYSGTAALIDSADDGTDELALVLALDNDQIQVTHFLYRP